MQDSASFNVLDARRPHGQFLESLGATVTLGALLAVLDFTVVDRVRHTVGLAIGKITVSPLGAIHVDLNDAEDQHTRAAVSHVAGLIGSAMLDGTPVTSQPITLPIPAAEAAPYLAAAVLADQLDRPEGCRTCGKRLRTHKPWAGGWVCAKCAEDHVATLEGTAASWWAEYRRRADAAERCLDSGRDRLPAERADLEAEVQYCRSSEGLLRVALDRFADATAYQARRAARKVAR